MRGSITSEIYFCAAPSNSSCFDRLGHILGASDEVVFFFQVNTPIAVHFFPDAGVFLVTAEQIVSELCYFDNHEISESGRKSRITE